MTKFLNRSISTNRSRRSKSPRTAPASGSATGRALATGALPCSSRNISSAVSVVSRFSKRSRLTVVGDHSAAHRTSSSKGVGLLRHADFLDRLQDGLASPNLNLDLSKLRCDLLSQFLLSAWHLLPPLVCFTPRFSLWKRCCLRGAGHEAAAHQSGTEKRDLPEVSPWDDLLDSESRLKPLKDRGTAEVK